ncbi:transposase [Streptomyces sp. SID13031]|uniref:transposase n=1 Tax=Streptomyces sp. SID13031 TaxID=2706046 RepID=UPI0013C8EA4D|nr:transposase [Streptomyces sp. SID13031]NEA37413.1 transposase [Streptomyces sp. SID13031]
MPDHSDSASLTDSGGNARGEIDTCTLSMPAARAFSNSSRSTAMASAKPMKMPRPRRSFTAEFKAEIVELCERGDRSVGQVAKDFDLTQTAVREWLKQAERDAGTGDGGVTSSERTSSRRCGGRTVGCAKTSTS